MSNDRKPIKSTNDKEGPEKGTKEQLTEEFNKAVAKQTKRIRKP